MTTPPTEDSAGHAGDRADTAAVSLARRLAATLVMVTAVTFACGLVAVPISAANAPNGGVHYPYLDTLGQYPRDFVWQYVGLVQVLVYAALFAVLQKSGRVSGAAVSLAKSFAAMASVVLLVAYYTQVSIVPASLAHRETDGLALLIQYNPRGLFIALEELGYLLVLLSFAALAYALEDGRTETRWMRRLSVGALALAVAARLGFDLRYGLDRLDRWEVVLVSTAWSSMMIHGVLLVRLLGRRGHAKT